MSERLFRVAVEPTRVLFHAQLGSVLDAGRHRFFSAVHTVIVIRSSGCWSGFFFFFSRVCNRATRLPRCRGTEFWFSYETTVGSKRGHTRENARGPRFKNASTLLSAGWEGGESGGTKEMADAWGSRARDVPGA